MASRTLHESFVVDLPLERTWEVMSDTQHLNQLFFGLGALRVVSRDDEKARLRGTFGVFAPEYDEYPWVFEVPRRYHSVRVFTRGVLRRLDVECVLEPAAGSFDGAPREDAPADRAHGDRALGDGPLKDPRTRVTYRLTIDAVDGPVGAVASWEVLRRTRGGLASARAFLGSLPVAGVSPVWPPANPQREAVFLRARAVAARIPVDDDDERAALERLVAHVADAPEADVARLRPYELADAWGAPRKKTLAACLRATSGGMLRLSWDLLCPACEGAVSVDSLKDLPAGGHCPACDIDFSTSFEENVEATFKPEPSVRAAARLVFCHGSPASTRSWLAQFVVTPGASHQTRMTLGPGRYRVQAAGVDGVTLLEATPAGEGAGQGEGGDASCVHVDIDRLGAGERPKLPAKVVTVAAGPVTLVVENKDTTPRRVQLAHRSFASRAATAADVTATGLFKELFGKEALAPGQHVAVGRRSILFTDLCGSTAMYERVGDAAAYGLVRDHFALLFGPIEKHQGRVVKTVGDCVMASFDTPVDAARAGRACVLALRTLRDPRGEIPGLKLKVGVHSGSCLAVEANGQVDYFGRTVNIAARVESIAQPDELVLSWTTVDDPDVQAFLEEARAAGDEIVPDQRKVKGIEGEVEIVRVAVKD